MILSPLPVLTTHQLDIDALPIGAVSRLEVTLAHDGLARPIGVPMLVARGEKPGPVFGLTAAIHGNELNGIPVIHRLFSQLNLAHLRGTVAAVLVVNVPGYLNHERVFLNTWDLNHSFGPVRNADAPSVYAHRLLDRIVSRFDTLIDLHTASFGRVNSLYLRADMTHAVTAEMAYLQRPEIIVHNPANDMTLRGAAAALGIPAVTLEIGNPQRFQREQIKRSTVGIRAVMSHHGMVRKRPIAMGAAPILCERSYWTYADRGGLLQVFPAVTDRVEAGETVAQLTNPYGDIITTYQAPEAGVVIGRSVNPVGQTGARILHLGIPADPGDSRFTHPPQKYRHQQEEAAP